MKQIVRVTIIVYTLCLLYWMFIGFGRTTLHNMQYNVLPFQTIGQYFANFHKFAFTTWLINIGGNIGVFMPFGLCIPYLLNLTFKRFVSWFIIVLFLVELTQMFTRRGSFDVDDILLNTVGALLDYFCYLLLKKVFRSKYVRDSGKTYSLERD